MPSQRLAFDGPLEWEAMLSYFAARSITSASDAEPARRLFNLGADVARSRRDLRRVDQRTEVGHR